MYGFWYDYVRQKYEEKSKIYYVDIYSFIVYINTDDIYKDRPLPKRKNKNVIGLTKNEVVGK